MTIDLFLVYKSHDELIRPFCHTRGDPFADCILTESNAKSLPYATLNFLGASLCGISAYMVSFYPFVILEGVWATVALLALLKHVPRGT